MKKVELLAPAGDFECLVAAIEAGANAVYISGKNFGARSYAKNFDNEEILKAIEFAHLRNAKVYITVNTILFEDELVEVKEYLDFLSTTNVDALIVQDLGLIKLIKTLYPSLCVHASTQLNIFNEKGVLTLNKMGVSRVVLARETPLTIIKDLARLGVELEVFIHGALCFSSSGNCYLSSIIGKRSGNRGKCAQPCRKKYTLLEDGFPLVKDEALLSMKDLFTLDQIPSLIEAGITSFKIEGRMKSKEYVYKTVEAYRNAIDSYYNNINYELTDEVLDDLKVTFNRSYTKGYLLGENNIDVVNHDFVNNQGILIGKVIKVNSSDIDIKLYKKLSVHDGLRIVGKSETGLIVNSLYVNGISVSYASPGDTVKLQVKSNINVGSNVLKTLSSDIEKEVNEAISKENIKYPLDLKVYLEVGKPLKLTCSFNDNHIEISSEVLEKCENFIGKARITEQLSKFGGTVYYLNNLDIITDEACFVKISSLNLVRRSLVEKLNDILLNDFKKDELHYNLNNNLEINKDEISIECVTSNFDQYEECIKAGLFTYNLGETYSGRIISDNKIMAHNLGQIDEFSVISPYFNLANKYSLSVVQDLGIDKCYLSPEIDINSIKKLDLNGLNLNVGVVAYGSIDAMVSKHCVVAACKGVKNKNCGFCKMHKYSLVDEYNEKFDLLLEKENDCTMRILNSRKVNVINFYNELKEAGVNKFLLIFTNETVEEVKEIINQFRIGSKTSDKKYIGFLIKRPE